MAAIRACGSRRIVPLSFVLTVVTISAFISIGCCAVADEKVEARQSPGKLKILVAGAHPDDPESAAGGLIALLCRDGHDVTVLYPVTYRTGRLVFDRPEKEVRQEECLAACKIMGGKPVFLEYAASEFYVDQANLDRFSNLLKEMQPDIVVTHWPMDSHPDHAALSLLIWRNYVRKGGWNLYHFEVNPGAQTIGFNPNVYIDIGDVLELKRGALMAHTSQKPETIWETHHGPSQLRRGKECGVLNAEAYHLLEAKEGCQLLPLKTLNHIAGQ